MLGAQSAYAFIENNGRGKLNFSSCGKITGYAEVIPKDIRLCPGWRQSVQSRKSRSRLAAWPAPSVDNMKTRLSGREPLHGAAEPQPDFLEIHVYDVTEFVGAKNRCLPAGSKRLAQRSPIFSSCSVRLVINSLIPLPGGVSCSRTPPRSSGLTP
jgi:hypothetical protein